MRAFLALALAWSLPAAAAAEEPLPGLREAGLLLRSAALARPECPAPAPGADDPRGPQPCLVPAGAWAPGQPLPEDPETSAPASPAPAALDSGFKALGGADQKGSVDGPGFKGNGRYQVVKSGRFEVALDVATGYMDSRFHLKRDPLSGEDTLTVSGKQWDSRKGAWGPYEADTFPAQFSYDAKSDTGAIRYKKGGKWLKEGYWRGKDGRTSMTIEFGGGWDHVFRRE